MAKTVWIRKYLADRGYADKDIGYDNVNKQVTLQGKNFYSATPDASGHTNADTGELQKALASFNTTQNETQLKTLSDSMIQKATAEPVKFTTAPTLVAPPPVQSYTAPAAYGGFDAENNPAYQAALRRATSNAKTASGNANADMNRRGILNSTITSDRNAQIQQGELGRVSDTILPQLMQQDYSQYRDKVGDAQYADNTNYSRAQDFFRGSNDVTQGNFNNLNNVEKANYGLSQDQMANLSNVINFLSGQGQQDLNNQRQQTLDARDLQNQHLALADKLSQEYGIQVSPKDDPALVYKQVQGLSPLALQQFKQNMAIEESQVTGMYNGKPTYEAQQATTKAATASSKANTPSASQDKLTYEGNVANEISQLLQTPGVTEADIDGYLETIRGDVTAHLTTIGFDRIAKSAKASLKSGSKVLQDADKQTSSTRKEAISLAKNDPDWYDETLREGLIQEYIGLLSGK